MLTQTNVKCVGLKPLQERSNLLSTLFVGVNKKGLIPKAAIVMTAVFFWSYFPLSVAIFFAAAKPPQKRIFTPIGARSSSGNSYQRQKCRLTLASLAPPLNLKIFPDVFKFNIRKVRNQQTCLFINLVARMSALIRHTENSGSRCRFNSVGGIFNDHAVFFVFSSEFGSQKKNLWMRF